MKKVAFYTLGCKVNQYDTQTMIELFKAENDKYQIVSFEEFADIYIVNTCTVTAMSDKKSRQILSRAFKQNNDALIVVAGCFAQTDAEKAMAIPGVRLVIGNKNRKSIVRLVDLAQHSQEPINAVEKITSTDDFEDLPAITEGQTRAYLKIQEGCNQFCSYCIIPFARGAIRSRSLNSIITQAKSLAQNGFKEIVITGIHLASYKTKQDEDLCDVIYALNDINGIERIRLGSLEPRVIDEKFVQAIKANKKVCLQIHLSLQSGCDEILKKMNRKYTTSDFENSVTLLRKNFPSVAITTDIIAGFPGETEADHNDTMLFIKKVKLSKTHVFPYSPRKSTVAAKMPNQIENSIKHMRAKEIITLTESLQREFISSFIGETKNVLFEQFEYGYLYGYTSNYIYTKVKSNQDLSNKIIPVKITGEQNLTAIGEMEE